MTYSEISSENLSVIIRRTNSDGSYSWIPKAPGNRDYREYLDWLAAGNTPLPAPIPEPPVELTPAEKLAQSGLTVAELKTLLGLE